MNYYAIIVAGGTGSRMGADIPKQFMLLDGVPLLMHTLHAFSRVQEKPGLILALNASYHTLWKELCIQYQFNIDHSLLAGGRERFYTVQQAIASIPDDSLVAIHDGVRPLVSEKLISDSYRKAQIHGSAVAAVQSRDSVRQLKGNHSQSLMRKEILLVQTPQVFPADKLKKAYQTSYSEDFTDDASVMEYAGFEISIIEGDPWNLKITYPEDLVIAESLLRGRK